MRKKIILAGLALMFLLSAGPGMAAGGFSGPGLGISTVEQARDMRDDAAVTLQGFIQKSLGGDDYLFKDETGTVAVEIKDRLWEGQDVAPTDKVEIRGEVDKDWHSIEIEAKSIKKL